jgi:hypothetical protein
MESILFLKQIKAYMKNFLNNKKIGTLLLGLVLISTACIKKYPGPGGTSALRGKVTGKEFKPGELEIQQITFTHGAQLEHGDYFLLNKVTGNNNYYIYFKNPNWVSVADPNLDGRIGLEVVFNYSDSNTEIAQAVKDKIASLGVLQFNMALNQDILILTYKSKENIPDPDNGTTNFAIDIVNQGKADYQGTAINNLAEQRVYLCYGDDQFPSVDLRTNAQGEFEFKDLQVGTYKVYVVGQLPPNANEHQEVSAVATISEKKSITDIGTLQIWY